MLRILRSLSRRQKQAIFLIGDLALLPVALYLSTALISDRFPFFTLTKDFWIELFALTMLAGLLSVSLGLPRIRLNAYSGPAIWRIAAFSVLLAGGHGCAALIAEQPILPGGLVLFAMTHFLMCLGGRRLLRKIVVWIYHRGGACQPMVIYGAGATGQKLATALRFSKNHDVVGFVDDACALQGKRICGAKVLAPAQLGEFIKNKGVKHAILAIPSLTQRKKTEIAKCFGLLGLQVQAVPPLAPIFGDGPLTEQLTEVSPNHLLGRGHLADQISMACDCYTGGTVLITGAGGSIGSELCRQVLSCRPARVILFELNEFALYSIDQELRSLSAVTQTEIVPILGSVSDSRQVRQVLERHQVDVVLHAAAYKHVPLVEENPAAGAKNNVMGTQTIAQAALQAGVGHFILVSSDKAVRPTNVMGATKRMAEMIVQDLASRSQSTCFAIVRFGNVLGSSGSVVPLFQEQIARGGPITVTHDQVSRYFMTVQEAVQLVLLAGSLAKGGEVFVLDMGKPVLIRDLARQMIEASGFTVRDAKNPSGDIEIVTIGLRPGEKLREELLIAEGMATTPHPKILCAPETGLSQIELAAMLKALQSAIDGGDPSAIKAIIYNCIEGFDTPTLPGAMAKHAALRAC